MRWVRPVCRHYWRATRVLDFGEELCKKDYLTSHIVVPLGVAKQS